MASPYKRRRPSLVRNFWVYRKLIALAMVLGLMLWFIWANNAPVTVSFPFRLGALTSSAGILILLSALVGSVVTALVMTMIFVVHRRKPAGAETEHDVPSALPEDRPPPDYATKTTEGFSDARWSS